MDSTLAKTLRTALKRTEPKRTRVLVLERLGNKIMSRLSNNNPFPRQSCERTRCPLRESNVHCYDRCYKEGVLYQAVCSRCHKQQEDLGLPVIRDFLYLGESSRILYTRYQQHI